MADHPDRWLFRYKLFIHLPIAVGAIVVPIGVGLGWPWWATVLLWVGGYVVVLTFGMVVGSALAEVGNREAAAMAKVTGPVTCDRCHVDNPTVCPRPHLGTCPLRSQETGKTYKDYLEKR
jgi:hypothetical protein